MSEVQAGDPHEPSYYEIALTNRQVLVAFVILLVCVVGAFFAGVWVGRGGTPQPGGALAASQVAPANPTGQPLQELQFFSGKPGQSAPSGQPDSPPAASGQPVPAAPSAAPSATTAPPVSRSPNQSLAADLSAKPEVTTAPAATPQALSQVPQPPAGSDAEPSSTPAAAPHATTPPTIAANGAKPKPLSAAAPAATSTPWASTAAVSGKAPEVAVGELLVQVFSSADGEQAKKTLARVNKGGFKAYLSPLLVGKQTMYRVRIGPFTDRAQAQKIADQVRKKFRLDTWITR